MTVTVCSADVSNVHDGCENNGQEDEPVFENQVQEAVLCVPWCPTGEDMAENAVWDGDADACEAAEGSGIGNEIVTCESSVDLTGGDGQLCELALDALNSNLMWRPKLNPLVCHDGRWTLSTVALVQSWQRVMGCAWQCLQVGRLFQPRGRPWL